MWKDQISTMLEGLECPILGRKGFAKPPQKLGEFPLYSYPYLMCSDVPSVVGV